MDCDLNKLAAAGALHRGRQLPGFYGKQLFSGFDDVMLLFVPFPDFSFFSAYAFQHDRNLFPRRIAHAGCRRLFLDLHRADRRASGYLASFLKAELCQRARVLAADLAVDPSGDA